MTSEGAIKKIAEVGIVPVVRAGSLDEARRAVDAVYAGGISVIEITMLRSASAIEDRIETVRSVSMPIVAEGGSAARN